MSLLLLFWPTFTEASKNHSFMCENISPAREFPSVSVMKCVVLSSGQSHFGTWLCFSRGRSLSSQQCCEGSSFKRAWLLSRRGSLMLLHLRHFFFLFRISLQDEILFPSGLLTCSEHLSVRCPPIMMSLPGYENFWPGLNKLTGRQMFTLEKCNRKSARRCESAPGALSSVETLHLLLGRWDDDFRWD